MVECWSLCQTEQVKAVPPDETEFVLAKNELP